MLGGRYSLSEKIKGLSLDPITQSNEWGAESLPVITRVCWCNGAGGWRPTRRPPPETRGASV